MELATASSNHQRLCKLARGGCMYRNSVSEAAYDRNGQPNYGRVQILDYCTECLKKQVSWGCANLVIQKSGTVTLLEVSFDPLQRDCE